MIRQTSKNIWNILLLGVIWVASVVVIGGVIRVAKELFCFGYGC
jgi:hypothetical protein